MATSSKAKLKSTPALKPQPARSAKSARTATPARKTKPGPDRVLYLYAISQPPSAKHALPQIAAEGMDGVAVVETILCEGQVCWVSRVDREEFADNLTANMENLDWLASSGLRHQRAVAAIAEKITALPARFGTVFLTEDSMAQHVRERKPALRAAFERVTDADEWGIKVFELAKPKASFSARNAPASGHEYLRRKAASMQPKSGRRLDDEVLGLVGKLSAVAAATSPGGKASAGQPGLLWSGSFLVKRKDRKKLESILKKYATTWHDRRRIDWSGPWPPYSFVGDSGPNRGERGD